ncbi:hypothetical protein [Aliidiomarina sanyensis]|uniref:Uncharacterized protein n=1 Tax=Aliidiomarina sanyensis TaxID=1249555 RepID=A0A432WB11_9GAMM|nr:hypothetical protein [Aliidiomarina sanyensis]RUO28191.1 hypothetical protein CWE11_10810 [Aliidiomarina sanyensis]
MATPILLDEYRDLPTKQQASLMIDESVTAMECLTELLEAAGSEKVEADKVAKLMKLHVNNIQAWSIEASE